MPLAQHSNVLQLGVLAVALYAIFKQVAPFLRRVPAGGDKSDFLSFPEGRSAFTAVIHV